MVDVFRLVLEAPIYLRIRQAQCSEESSALALSPCGGDNAPAQREAYADDLGPRQPPFQYIYIYIQVYVYLPIYVQYSIWCGNCPPTYLHFMIHHTHQARRQQHPTTVQRRCRHEPTRPGEYGVRARSCCSPDFLLGWAFPSVEGPAEGPPHDISGRLVAWCFAQLPCVGLYLSHIGGRTV